MSRRRRQRQEERRQSVRLYRQGAGVPDDLRRNVRGGTHWVVLTAGLPRDAAIRLAQDLADGGKRASFATQVAWLDLPSGCAVLFLVPRSACAFRAVLAGLKVEAAWSEEAERSGLLALARPEVLPKALAELDALIGDGETLVAGEVLAGPGKAEGT